jgi:predicted enzyme related to lactoylglutathione lyase
MDFIQQKIKFNIMNSNVIGWFELPVSDMDRAIKFYETVFEIKLSRHILGPLDMAWFPSVENGSGSAGSLVFNKAYKPSADGVLIYFTARSGDVSIELGRVEKAGGKVLMQRTPISENFGFMGLIIDSEGNRIALHSRK